MSRLRKQSAATGRRRMHRRRWRQAGETAPTRDELLEAAAEDALEMGKNLTTIRKHVLNVLLDARRPMTAYDVLASMEGVGSVSPPTAYRALEFLIDLGFVQRVESLNAYIALDRGPSDTPVAFFVCEDCNQVKEIAANETVTHMLDAIDDEGFSIHSLSLEMRGKCRGRLDCAPRPRPPATSASIAKHRSD